MGCQTVEQCCIEHGAPNPTSFDSLARAYLAMYLYGVGQQAAERRRRSHLALGQFQTDDQKYQQCRNFGLDFLLKTVSQTKPI